MDNFGFLGQKQIEFYLNQALKEAYQAYDKHNEVPVGCVFVKLINGKYQIVARSHNLTNEKQSAIFHCEINCIKEMEKKMKIQQISECILFVTVQPCIMCTHALNIMKIKQVYFGQFNDRFGGCGSVIKHNQFDFKGGILQKQSLLLIKKFYQRGNQKLNHEGYHKKKKQIKKNQEIIHQNNT